MLVTLIIHQLLEKREKKHLMEKLNMLIGVFFSEMGNTLLADFSDLDENLDKIKNNLILDTCCNRVDFCKIKTEFF